MNSTLLKDFLASVIRKILFGVGSVWIAKILSTGAITEGDINRWIEIAAALIIIGGSALWTTVNEWLKNRKAAATPDPAKPA